MGYEVYLPTNSIRSDSKEARGEYVVIPWQKGGDDVIREEYNEKGSVSLIKGGGNYLRGRFSANSLNIFLVVIQYIFMLCTHDAFVSF